MEKSKERIENDIRETPGKKDKRKALGRLGESIAEEYLRKNGYIILENNFKVHKLGEIDIIAKHNECICFIEVKTRTGIDFGIPSEAVGRQKQAKIRRLAQIYIMKNGLFDHDARFDVIEILISCFKAHEKCGQLDCKNEKYNNENGKHEHKNNQDYEVKSINFIESAFF